MNTDPFGTSRSDPQYVKSQLTVWWVLWAVFQTSPFYYHTYLCLPHANQTSTVADSPAWIAGLIPLLFSILIRWLILPRVKIPQAALATAIIGIAFAESTSFMGIYIYSSREHLFFILSLLGILQFIPFYAARLYARQG